MSKKEGLFEQRMQRHHDELRWLYMELYQNGDMFAELCDRLKEYDRVRNPKLKRLDEQREARPGWFKDRNMLGMMLYIDNFAGTINGVKSKLDYLQSCQVNTIHLMPFLDSPEGRSDGGYAVADFRSPVAA